MTHAVPRRSGRRACLGLLVATVTGCGFLPISRTSLVGTGVLATAAKPPLVDSTGECGPSGMRPDLALNRRKNRIDDGRYLPVSWSLVARLPWPRLVGYRFRNQWTRGEQRKVARYEGAAVEVTGYVVNYLREGAEPTNCYSRDPSAEDYHLWISQRAHADKKHSIVVELTPRVRVHHAGWTDERLAALVAAQVPVRVRGWLMLDQMHPGAVGRTRITLWEVHPVMHLDWQQPDSSWVSLDSLVPPATHRPSAAPQR